MKLYPSVGMKKQPNVHISVNFGQQPFMFDIDGMVKVGWICCLELDGYADSVYRKRNSQFKRRLAQPVRLAYSLH